MKIAFLDRDGTINKDYPDKEWKNRLIPQFLEGAINGAQKLTQLGYRIIIITNQYIIGDGIISLDDYNKFTANLRNKFTEENIEILDIFYCPHSQSENCICRKPKNGMIQKAISKHVSINLNESILIGDSLCDKMLAKALNISFYGIVGKDFSRKTNSYKSIYEVAEEIEQNKIT